MSVFPGIMQQAGSHGGHLGTLTATQSHGSDEPPVEGQS